MRYHPALFDHPVGFAQRVKGRLYDPVSALISGGAAILGGAISSNASKDAASTQSDAAKYAADLQQKQWQQTQTNMAPYLQLGNSAISPLLAAMGYKTTQNADGTTSFNGVDSNNILQQTFSAPTEAQAQATPGYQFTLNQGLKATQNSAAARGLGTSGAALKGAAAYSTGLADSTYNDVYSRALNTFNTNYSSAANNANRLSNLVSSGQNAAGGLASVGAQTTANIGNTLTSGANATASGTVGSANALSSALGSLGNTATIYGLTQNNAAGSQAYQSAVGNTASTVANGGVANALF